MIVGLGFTVVAFAVAGRRTRRRSGASSCWLLTIIEAYGALFSRTFAIPGIGHWAAIGFIEDLFATGVLAGIITFTIIRLRNDPHREGRRSRFFGSSAPRGSCSP
jgi:uncharacterized membrane protein YhaH (DUF805 family)